MKHDVFDTYVTRTDGAMMHFDVLVPSKGDKQQASKYAEEWLRSIGVNFDQIQSSSCSFCHSEPTNPEFERAIKHKGYAILQLEGCPGSNL